ncbi:MAG: GH3 auxin-responsive promoter family protein [Candidatus Peribacteria bacterium]|nr:MAG: GH3 auxin-responsive promoter family protein [Candidatus Peribacteria bacterium]
MKQVWPNFEFCAHGGISIQAYAEELKAMLPEKTFFMEIYSASEGMFAIQDTEQSKDLLLLPHRGIFFYFKDTENGNVCPLTQVQPGKDYSLIISTNA